MPVQPTYPGVYVQEAPSGIRTITGVSTSVTAFLGFFRKGPLNQPRQIFNVGDFQREFGGLDTESEASYAIEQFFLNGGEQAWVVRTAASDTANPLGTSSVIAASAPGKDGIPTVKVDASSPGSWGNNVKLDIDWATSNPLEFFNITATEFVVEDGQPRVIQTLTIRNLTMDPSAPNYAVSVIQQTNGSLVQLEDLLPDTGGVPPEGGWPRPAQTGTVGEKIQNSDLPFKGGTMTVQMGDQKYTVTVAKADTRFQLPAVVQAALRSQPALSSAVVEMVADSLRVFLTDPLLANQTLVFTGSAANALKLTKGLVNIQRYSLGEGVTAGAQSGATKGGDGLPPGATELIGSEFERTGIYALDSVDIFNILAIPRTRDLTETAAMSVIQTCLNYCEARQAFMVVDMTANVNSIEGARSWMEANALVANKNAAVYFPNVMVPDPLNEFRLRAFGPSGTMAGLYARTDAQRGVWKAPAGVDATLRGATALEYKMTDAENGALNPLGINCLRNFPVYANVSWGARTMVGSDQRASEWKYIPVRRVALMIMESLRRGLQWVVFEPNGEVLWSQIRLNVNAFMQTLFVQGAFKGESPEQAYSVKCDASTTSQNDIDRGIVNVVVGFAPLKPAEFVILTLEQLTGQSDS
ncbi:MAG: phage tail sheath C-terminal domain-containing protein [Acidobacteriota bacterium]